MIVTYGDDQTEYPHPDHLRVHEISVVAFDAAGDPDRFPEAGPPFTPAKLYYSVWSGERFRQIHAKYVELGLESPFDDKWLARMTRTEPFTTTIDVTGFTEVRGAALEGARHPGRPNVAVLVRSPARGDARHPPGRRVPPGPEPRRPHRRHRGRSLRRGPLRLRPDQAVGPRKPQLITPGALQQHERHGGGQQAEQHERRDRPPRRGRPAPGPDPPAPFHPEGRLRYLRRRSVGR